MKEEKMRNILHFLWKDLLSSQSIIIIIDKHIEDL